MIIFRADSDVSKMTARSCTMPMNHTRRTINNIAGMHDLNLTI